MADTTVWTSLEHHLGQLGFTWNLHGQRLGNTGKKARQRQYFPFICYRHPSQMVNNRKSMLYYMPQLYFGKHCNLQIDVFPRSWHFMQTYHVSCLSHGKQTGS